MGEVILNDYLDVVLKVCGAWAAGSLIGLERSFHGRPAGFRTHALVCIASALLMLITSCEWLDGTPAEVIRTDPTRTAQGIMTGIGFLGGGVIFKEGLTVRGLTTAASIWTTAAVGILFGVGMYFPALFGTLLTLGILAVFRRFETLIPNRFFAHYTVRFPKDQAPSEAEVRRLLRDHGFKAAAMSYGLIEDGTAFEYRTVINSASRANAEALVEHLRSAANVTSFSVAPTGD
jgi:putative Mg2+ transporter-C (MgtC) family protein